MKQILILFFGLFISNYLIGQSTTIPLNSDLHQFIKRLDIQGKTHIHTSHNDFSSREVFEEIITSYSTFTNKDKVLAKKLILRYPEFWESSSKLESDDFQKEYIDSNNVFYAGKSTPSDFSELQNIMSSDRPILKYFYSNRAYFSKISTKDFLLKINPIIYFGVGRDLNQKEYTFVNSRGIELSGHINNKIFFYSDILETQAGFPSYIRAFEKANKAIPGNGLYKTYNSVILGDQAGYDFLNAQAYINANITKNIGLEFGNGRNKLGNGNRSLLLSDFSNNYLYLKFKTNVWKIHYQNLFTELIPFTANSIPGNNIINRKYSASHFLSFKHKNIEVGIFESVIFERDGGFDLQYLNPVILYRLVEHNLNSSDNVLVGINGKLNISDKFQIYGQLILDEFLLREFVIERRGWWANKFGIQLGGKYINAFNTDHLDISLEYNRVRPYTYSHRSLASYSHASQPLAHPLGANFQEVNFSVDYLINDRLRFSSSTYFISQGLDTDSTYFGSNILTSTSNRPAGMIYGNQLLQGNLSTTLLSKNRMSYEFFPNYFLDLNLIYRNFDSEMSPSSKNFILSGGIRINFWERPVDI